MEGVRRLEDSFSREQLLAANDILIQRNKQLERGIAQEYVDLASKMIEGFVVTAIDAANGNTTAREQIEKFLDALRIAQGKTIKAPRMIDTPNGPIVVEAEGKSEPLPDPNDPFGEILAEGEDTHATG